VFICVSLEGCDEGNTLGAATTDLCQNRFSISSGTEMKYENREFMQWRHFDFCFEFLKFFLIQNRNSLMGINVVKSIVVKNGKSKEINYI